MEAMTLREAKGNRSGGLQPGILARSFRDLEAAAKIVFAPFLHP